jgi:hypothetical protein
LTSAVGLEYNRIINGGDPTNRRRETMKNQTSKNETQNQTVVDPSIIRRRDHARVSWLADAMLRAEEYEPGKKRKSARLERHIRQAQQHVDAAEDAYWTELYGSDPRMCAAK